jgi:flagellar protein FliO/FliZ
MIASVLILSLGTFASPVIISEVRATREAGHLRVEVDGDGGIDPDLAHAMIDGGRMFLYLGGTRVRADNRSWDLADGTGSVQAHRHRLQTELVIPLASNGCAGPVELAGSPRGITALVGCEGGTSSVAEPAATRRASSAEPRSGAATAAGVGSMRAAVAPRRERASAAAEGVPEKDAETRLKALVALPPERTERPLAAADSDPLSATSPRVAGGSPGAGIPRPVMPVLAVAAAPVPVAPPSATTATTLVTTSPTTPPKQSAELAPPGTTPSSTAAAPTPALALALASPPAGHALTTADTRSASIAAPAIGLAVLAGAAYLFARRRRATSPRHIQIIETASLGPKRSLVVARIGDETLFLGTSEAGITLLKSSRDLPQRREPELVSEAELHETDIPIAEALADIPQPSGLDLAATPRAGLRTIEGGLASLFGRRGFPSGSTIESATSTDDLSFDDVLEDSVEDQELRRKLAAGLSARAR